MTWRPDIIDGPIAILILGEPAENGEQAITGYVPGYHLNVAPHLLTDALQPYRVDPEPGTPFRVFAGADTGFLRFADEAEARAALPAYWIA